jgi:hypothetical protein
MIGAIIAIVISIIVLSIAWKILPYLVHRFGEMYQLDAVNKLMVFLCFLFAIFLLWVGMPAFTATIKFMMFGQSFSSLFKLPYIYQWADEIGGVMLNISAFCLWLGVNAAELYPKVVKGNREALEAMLAARQGRKSIRIDDADDIETRLIKHQMRKSQGLSLGSASIVCCVAFFVDTIIAVCHTPIIKAGGDFSKILRLGSFTQLDFKGICVLALLIAGMTFNAAVFEQFNQQPKPKRLPPAQH